ncbi:MAG: hypothetical protein J6V12_07210 [Bacteroidaceae bacterium]|jgi:hypothetical protein|nr:hypothetical protein [Bacteroidaceae bacterium]
MSKPRFFSVPSEVADTIVRRELRRSWSENGLVKVLLSSSDLYTYGIERAIQHGAVELTSDDVKQLLIQ